MNDYEVSLLEAQMTIKLHKKFLAQIRQQTELKPDYGLYSELMQLVLKDFRVYGLRDHICPTMRVAPIKVWPNFGYGHGYCHIQGDRVLLRREKHNVELCISFNLEEFAKYLLLTDAEYIGSYDLKYILNSYSLSLMDKIRSENPKRVLLKKDFTIDFYNADSEKVRVRMAEILSHYMSIVTKERLRVSKPVKIIEKMYGMPARDKRVAAYRQLYII